MHELSIAQSILTIAENAVPADSKGTVTAMNLQIGELSSIETEALRFAFSAIKEDTILQNADLNIEIIPGEASCQDCQTVFHMPSYGTPCPQCESFSLKVTGGKELKVISITMEE